MIERVSTLIAQIRILAEFTCSLLLAALETQIKQSPIKPVNKRQTPKATGKDGGDDSTASGACWVEKADDNWTWGKGTFTLHAKDAAADLGCSIDHYCWAIVGMKNTLAPSLLTFVQKCCPCPSRGGEESVIHKRSLEAREDVAVTAIVCKHAYNNNTTQEHRSRQDQHQPNAPFSLRTVVAVVTVARSPETTLIRPPLTSPSNRWAITRSSTN